MVEHNCTLEASQPKIITRSGHNFLKLLQPLIVVSNAHPATKVNFPSKYHIQREISRHISDNYWYIIHPNSILMLCWDALMMVIFYSQFMFTLLFYTFIRELQSLSSGWNVTALIFDVLCVANILLKFFVGYQEERSKKIILNRRSIARHYLTQDFAFDLLTSLPVTLIISVVAPRLSIGYTSVWYHLVYWMKLGRLWSFCSFVFWRLFGMTHLKCQILLLIIKALTFIHIFICIHKLVVWLIYNPDDFEELEQMNLFKSYFKTFDYVIWMLFGSATGDESDLMIESKVLITIGSIMSFAFNIYIISQILVIVGTMSASKIKYYQMMDQLDAYAQKKQLPMHIQQRLRFFFDKRFRNDQFFGDKVSNIFSDTLKNEILVNLGQKFMKNFQLLDGVPQTVLTQMLHKCRKEHFLPNDIIIKAGTTGDQIYFLTSGTVCVETANGKELCHCQEGEYFGEIGLALKNNKRITTVTAIEFCEVYAIDYRSFMKCFQVNRTIMQRLQRVAEMRLKLMLAAEEIHKKILNKRIALEASG